MSVSAIVMMCIAVVTVWGGLVAAVINLRKHPEALDDED